MAKTVVYSGDWALIQETIGGSFKTLTGLKEDAFVNQWKQAGLQRSVLVFRDPDVKKPPKGFKPRVDRHLVWSKDAPAAWVKWCKDQGVEYSQLRAPDRAAIEQVLLGGTGGVEFEPDAARWFADLMDGNYAALMNGLEVLAVMPGPITIQTLAGTWDTPSLYIANVLDKHLGTLRGLELAAKIPREDAYRLLNYYLTKSVKKPSWVHGLQGIRKAVDDVKLDPWSGVQIFALYTYQEAAWQSSSRGGKSSSLPKSTPLQALYRSLGMPWCPYGAKNKPSYRPGLRLMTSPVSRGS